MAMAKYSTQTWNIFHPITHHFPRKSPNHSVSLPFYKTPSDFSSLSVSPHLNNNLAPAHLSFKAFASSSSSSSFSVGSAEYTEETATKEKFQTSLSLPGCSTSLSLLGTGYREKVFAIIGVKVYAAGLYVNPSILSTLSTWKGQSASEIQDNSALFSLDFPSSLGKIITDCSGERC
ncbi:hypothetical protein OIU77_009112 [Salix suchowensis]|uniref:Chalcone-flavonone isomerase family protein n=1 Tax=Salix suchowensis TaxID=1278906 RepID=A0ABQ9AD86_9ROSI|nr:hypothetical protein OIU77_009112 [Salix suchowensis]